MLKRKRKWLTITAIALVLMTISLFGLRWGWSRQARRDYEAQIAAARSSGEPFFAGDFSSSISDDDNAAIAYSRAADAVQLDSEQAALFESLESEIPMTAAQLTKMSGVVKSNQPALDLAHAAAKKTACHWNINYSDAAHLPYLNSQRKLAEFLTSVAKYQHQTGNDAAAVQTLTDLSAQVAAMDRDCPFLVCKLVSIGIAALCDDTIFLITPELNVSKRDAASTAGSVSSELVHRLIDARLDDAAARKATVQMFCGERLMFVKLFDQSLPLSSPKWFVWPLMQSDLVACIQYYSDVAQISGGRDRFERTGSKRIVNPGDHEPNRLTRPYSPLIFPAGYSLELHFISLASRQAAAADLAIALFKADHAGKFPESLNELVPAYLPTIPIDPMARNHPPLHYLPNAAQPIIYSVGENEKDDGGSERLVRINPNIRVQSRKDMPDLVFHLTTQPIPPEESAPKLDDLLNDNN